MRNIEEFEGLINYTFTDKQLIYRALSHSSYANERQHMYESNERLEFLGDSVLSIVVSEYLFTNFQGTEGYLTKLRSSLVCEKSLYFFARQIHLSDYLMLGKGEVNTGGLERKSILADAFEAVIAAIYLDGGIDAARNYILRFIPQDIENNKNLIFNDFKTVLQELVQKNTADKLKYILVGAEGPDHNKSFVVEIMLNSQIIGKGSGRNKKEAEQLAAKEALEFIGWTMTSSDC